MQTVKMISDSQFESMGLAIGQIAKIKALILSENKGAEKSEGMSMFVNVWRCGGLMVSALVRAPTGDIVLCSWPRHFSQCLTPRSQEYK